jgi:hypothetical protein
VAFSDAFGGERVADGAGRAGSCVLRTWSGESRSCRDSDPEKDSFRDSSSGVRTHFWSSEGLMWGTQKSRKPRKHLVAEAPRG